MEKLETNVQLSTSHRKLADKISLMGYCIICLKKGRGFNKVSSSSNEDRLVVGTPSFLNTLNEIWRVLQSDSKSKPRQQNEDNSLSKVSMEDVLLEGSKEGASFSGVPALCQLCHGKIVVLENLMKAVRRQVQGIKLVLMESRKGGRFEGRLDNFEMALKENGLEDSEIKSTMQIVDIFGSSSMEQQHNENVESEEATATNAGQRNDQDHNSHSIQIDKEEDWHWQESKGSMDQEEMPSQSSSSIALETELPNSCTLVKSEDNSKVSNAADDDEADEDDSNWSWDGDEDDDTINIKAEDENERDDIDGDEDDSPNWPCEDKDPVNIKSEEMDEGDDDDDSGDNEELSRDQCEDEEEEFMTVEGDQSIPVIEKDPLEIPFHCSKRKIDNLTTLTTKSTTPTASSSSSSSQIFCDVENCTWKSSTVSALFTHKRSCHPSPAQKLLNVRKFKKASILRRSASAAGTSSSQKLYPCDLEACTQILLSVESLYRHKMQCHSDLMTQLKKFAPPPIYKFQCSCGRRFQSHQARYLHMSKNQGTHPEFIPEIKIELGSQNCDQCGESVKLTNILEHLSGSHLGGSSEHVIRCPNYDQCGHMFTHSKDLHELHLPSITKRLGNSCRRKAQESKCDLICETCGFTAGKRIRLQTHVANEHERGTLPKNLKCPISGCDKMFAVKQSVYFHLHVHRQRPPITNQLCKFCLQPIKIEEIEGHLKDKHGILEVISCKMCPYKFSEREGFVEHLREHRLSCDICGATCQGKLRLTRHQEREHGMGENASQKEWKCELDKCGRIFKKKHYWERHVNVVHKGIKRFVCDICGKAFGLPASLKGHRDAVHLGLRPWGCEECGERFATSSILKHHKLIHTGERPFGCGICGQRFRHKEVLNRHEKGHEEKGKDFRPNGPMKKIRKRIAPQSRSSVIRKK